MGERVVTPFARDVALGGRREQTDDPTMTARPSGRSSGSGGRAEPPGILSGRKLAHFELKGLLGAGGFGEVYRARDTRLDRDVAVKVLPASVAVDAERRERFRREARAASALNHQHICTVHDLVEAEGHFLIVMELVEGQTLHEVLAKGPFSPAEALAIALQVAEALGEAHRAGILHRDIKCRNIALTGRGQVKVLDFGLAKLVDRKLREDEATLEKLTEDGASPGTPGYMSPEQLLSKPLDARSDLFSFGVVLYRMVTGRLPFEGTSKMALADAILHAEPRGFGDRAIPEGLREVVRKLLQKDPEKRYANADEVHAELKALAEALSPARGRLSRTTRLALVAAGFVVVVAGGWFWHRWARERWALQTIPEIERRIETDELWKAAPLLREARAILPGNPTLEALWKKATDEETLDTVPSGATVSIEPVPAGCGPIEVVGRTPLKKRRVVSGIGIWRVSKAGFASFEAFGAPNDDGVVKLWRASDVPPGMSVVQGGQAGLPSPFAYDRRLAIEDFFIDRHEVSNADYARFVEAGGYRKREYWKQPFVRDGKSVPWEEAIATFRDSTGRAGPATWEVGHPPKGREDHPVSGISWYEAAAYAEFAGKSLPSVYHWTWASQPWAAYLIVPGSNFRDTETWPCGRPGTASGFGTSDMAGNVKEWCWNESWAGKRYILGGGFGEPEYGFTQTDAQSPWSRLPNYGFRCVKLPTPGPAASFEKLERTVVDYSREKPVSNEVFAAIRGLYAYDRSGLQAKVEGTAKEEDATHETVSFRAAYGAERVRLHLFLPVNATPPYQPVLYFPGAYALFAKEFRVDQLADSALFSSFLRAGRAVVFPIYRGTFERKDGLKVGGPETNPDGTWRDHVVDWSKDIGRSLDYLETRGDFDLSKLGYVGYSLGGATAPEFLSVETRFRAAVLACSGLFGRRALPEADAFNFLPRVRIPTLLVGGKYDHRFPMVTSQIPFYNSLGTPTADKRQVFCEAGHFPPLKDYIRESLAWLDKYLGPVTPKGAPKE